MASIVDLPVRSGEDNFLAYKSK